MTVLQTLKFLIITYTHIGFSQSSGEILRDQLINGAVSSASQPANILT